MSEVSFEFGTVGAEKVFRDALDNNEFNIQRCADCEKFVFYPRTLCVHCGSPRLNWQSASGSAVVYATTTERFKPEAGGDRNLAVVKLEEGPKMMTRITGVAPDEVQIGMRVEAYIDTADGAKIIYFRKA
jgi:uncharacterized OB-fold protein